MSEIPDNVDIRAAVGELFLPGRSDEIAFWARLAGQYGRSVLVAMCGPGDLACELAEAGLIVTGADDSEASLASAQRRREDMGQDARERVRFQQVGASKGFELADQFDFALIGGGAFGRLLTKPAQTQVLGSIYKALRPGGGVGMELISVAGAESGSGSGRSERLVPTKQMQSDLKVEKVSVRRYDAKTQRLTIEDSFAVDSGEASQEFKRESTLAAFQPDKAESLLAEAGFEELSAYGDYGMTPYSEGCHKLIVVAERPMCEAVGESGTEKE